MLQDTSGLAALGANLAAGSVVAVATVAASSTRISRSSSGASTSVTPVPVVNRSRSLMRMCASKALSSRIAHEASVSRNSGLSTRSRMRFTQVSMVVALGVQHQLVEQRVLPIDAIRDLQGALVGSVVAFDFPPRGAPVLEAGPLHHRPLADFHRGTDADAHHVRHLSQNDTRSPAADQGRFPFALGRGFPRPCKAPGACSGFCQRPRRVAAFETVMDGTIPHVHVLGEMMLDQFVENTVSPILSATPCGTSLPPEPISRVIATTGIMYSQGFSGGRMQPGALRATPI